MFKKILIFIASIILRNIPSHYYRKKFAKLTGRYFDGVIAKTAYGFPMIAKWNDNMNRIGFEGSYGVVQNFIENLPKDVMFIDIGANQGYTSILASYCLGRENIKADILSFEPSLSSYNLMIKKKIRVK